MHKVNTIPVSTGQQDLLDPFPSLVCLSELVIAASCPIGIHAAGLPRTYNLYIACFVGSRSNTRLAIPLWYRGRLCDTSQSWPPVCWHSYTVRHLHGSLCTLVSYNLIWTNSLNGLPGPQVSLDCRSCLYNQSFQFPRRARFARLLHENHSPQGHHEIPSLDQQLLEITWYRPPLPDQPLPLLKQQPQSHRRQAGCR